MLMEIKIICKEDGRVGELINALLSALNSYTESYTIESTIKIEEPKK